MPRAIPPRLVFLPGPIAVALSLAGCSGADSPKLADAPPVAIPEKVPTPKIPGKKTEYGANAKYQEIMEKQATQQGNR